MQSRQPCPDRRSEGEGCVTQHRHIPDPPPTLEEYLALEKAGKLTRPLTNDPIQTGRNIPVTEPPKSLIDQYLPVEPDR